MNGDVDEKVVVFDEKYIDENIGLKDDGLDTIILIGKQKTIDDEENKIKEKNELLKKVVNNIKKS